MIIINIKMIVVVIVNIIITIIIVIIIIISLITQHLSAGKPSPISDCQWN
jgi:hypothetical protein